MAVTNAWDEAVPAGGDAANTLDSVIRDMKLDIRERMERTTQWDVSLAVDGLPIAPQTLTSTGTQNDLALNSGVTMVRLNNSSALTITGIAAGYDGQLLHFVSVGSANVSFTNEDLGSTAANRLITGYAALLVAAEGTITFRYDATSARWRMLSHEMGTLTFTPQLQFGGANVGMTQSVAQGVIRRMGKHLHMTIRITLSAKGSSTGTAKITGLPVTGGSYYWVFGPAYFLNLATDVACLMGYNSGSTVIDLVVVAAAGASNCANMTQSYFNNNTDIILSGTYLGA